VSSLVLLVGVEGGCGVVLVGVGVLVTSVTDGDGDVVVSIDVGSVAVGVVGMFSTTQVVGGACDDDDDDDDDDAAGCVALCVVVAAMIGGCELLHSEATGARVRRYTLAFRGGKRSTA
jgi:hypothetical protein